jgi:hypothetical protein
LELNGSLQKASGKGRVMLRGGLHQHSSSHQDLAHLQKLPNKLQVSVSGDMGPTPPGHHHRILSDGMSLITPVVLTERSSSHLRSSAPVPYDQRLSKYVIHGNQVNDVSISSGIFLARSRYSVTRTVPHKLSEYGSSQRERRDDAKPSQLVSSAGELQGERTRKSGLS